MNPAAVSASREPLLDRLEAGACVVTGSQRLARSLREAHDRRQLGRGRAGWSSADVLPWTSWLQREHRRIEETRLFAGRDPGPTLLSEAQAEALWQRRVERDERATLLQTRGTAQCAREAYRLVRDWQIPRARLDQWSVPETEVLLAWGEACARDCEARGWLDPGALAQVLAQAATAGEWDDSRPLVLSGFDELSPGQQNLLAALGEAGVQIDWIEIEGRPGDLVRVAAADPEHELELAARWARCNIERAPAGRFALVAPDLAGDRDAIEQALIREFCPGGGGEDLRAWADFSYGRPLARWPLVDAALLQLRLLVMGRLTPGEASRLLRSPFTRSAEAEFAARVAADLDLRLGGQAEIDLNLLGAACARAGAGQLGQSLQALAGESYAGQDTPAGWAGRFYRALLSLGWPGPAAELDSTEYQTRLAFEALLDDFCDLGRVLGHLGAGAALARLRQLAGDRLFQPESRGDPPLQVLGMLEAPGQAFDAIWVLGLTDGVWPAPAQPNPFLAPGLQARYGLPRASAARELEYARRLWQRLLGCAPTIRVSYPRRRGDELLRPSPLLAGCTELTAEDAAGVPALAYAEQLQAAGRLESLPDTRGPALAPGGRTGGGAGLFKDFIACPFKAFGHYRLAAQAPGDPGYGPDARVRGEWVHRLLEDLWARLGDSARLRERRADGRLAADIEAAIERLRSRDPRLARGRVAQIELHRLGQRLRDWLAVELGREDFRVEAREQTLGMQIGPLRITARPDRVDRLADGRILIIDYKTGRCHRRDLADSRPREPQLPLYAVFGGHRVDAVALASLRVGELGFHGLGREDSGIDGVVGVDPGINQAGWDGLLLAWRDSLIEVAEAFAAGAAAVAPREPQSCRYCDLPVLCRIGLQAGTDDASD